MTDCRDIKNYEGLYAVTREGFVYSYKTKKLLKGMSNRNGYMYIGLRKDGIRTDFLVHRLVGEAFIPNPENKPEIDHINGDRKDNRVENLRWATKKENRRNPITTKRMSEKKKGLPARNRRRVIQLDSENNIIGIYESLIIASKITETKRPSISACVTGKRKMANGFKWRYYDN